MPKPTAKPQKLTNNGISKQQSDIRGSYKMTRTVRFNNILYEKGKQVEFTNKNIEKMFLQNNYII